MDTLASAGSLDIVVSGGAELLTIGFKRASLSLEQGSKETILPNGKTSMLTSLVVGEGATFDISNNALVIDYSGTSPVATVRETILSGRGGAGLGKGWNGTGITSSAAAAANAVDAERCESGWVGE
jgi:hypothetical protein